MHPVISLCYDLYPHNHLPRFDKIWVKVCIVTRGHLQSNKKGNQNSNLLVN